MYIPTSWIFQTPFSSVAAEPGKCFSVVCYCYCCKLKLNRDGGLAISVEKRNLELVNIFAQMSY